MQISPLIFSNNPRYRIGRHVLFWSGWILYYTALNVLSFRQTIPVSKSFFPSLIEVTISTPMDILFCYMILYFVFPRFLYRGKYISMVVSWVLLSCLFIVVFVSYTRFMLPSIREFFSMPKPQFSSSYTWIFFNLFSQINMEFALAGVIKLGKMWFIKSEELQLLQKQKSDFVPERADLSIQPFFLMNALDKVERFSQTSPAVIPSMIKKIKKLLLYHTYYQHQSRVNLSDELSLLQEYIDLEKASTETPLFTHLHISGEAGSKKIAPFIILPLVEYCFRQMTSLDQQEKHITINIMINQESIAVTIEWKKPADTSTLMTSNHSFLQTISKRLKILYPGSHSLTATIQPDLFFVKLHMGLDKGAGL